MNAWTPVVPVNVDPVVLMDATEARAAATAITSTAADLRRRIYEFETREGWRALGYDSFRSWAIAEVDQSTRHVYRQLAAAEAEAALGVTIGHTPESHLRPLTGLSPDLQRDAWARAQELADTAPVNASHVETAAGEVVRLDAGIADVRRRARALGLLVVRQEDAFILQSDNSTPVNIYRFTCGADGARNIRSEIDAITRLNNDLMEIEEAALTEQAQTTDQDAPLTEEELVDLSRIGGWDPDGKGTHFTSSQGLPMVRLMSTRWSDEGTPYVETRTPGGWRIMLADLREQEALRERNRDRERRGIATRVPDEAIPDDWDDWQFAARRLGLELRMSHLGAISLMTGDTLICRTSTKKGWPEICAAITAREPAPAVEVKADAAAALAPDGWRWREGRSGPDYWQAERISDGRVSACGHTADEIYANVERIKCLGRIARSEECFADRAQQLGGTFTTLEKGKNAPAYSVHIPPASPRLFAFERDEDGEGYDLPSALSALDQVREYLEAIAPRQQGGSAPIEEGQAPISAPPTHIEISSDQDSAFWIDDDDGPAIYVRDTGLPPLIAEAIAEVANSLRLLCLGQAHAVDAEVLFELSRAIGGTANQARSTLAGVLSLVGSDAEEHAARRAA